MRRWWPGVLVLLLWVSTTWSAVADAPWEVYVNNQKFGAVTRGNADTMQVDIKAFARATGLTYDHDAGGTTSFNGKTVSVTTTDGTDYVPLKTLVDLAGMQMDVRSDLQMIDIRPRPQVHSQEDIEKEMVHAWRVETYPQMQYLYGLVRDAYDQRLHLTITHPVETHWCTLAEIHKMAGADGYGYSTAKVRGSELVSLDLYVPFGLSPSTTLHSLAHELGHCWQYDHGVFNGPPLKMEGFAEWCASKVLENLTLAGELQAMRLNLYAQYRDGFTYFQNLERTQGVNAVLKDMLATRK